MSLGVMVCYYKILGVSVKASQEEIKKAFRMLALRWHPDRNPQDNQASERFKEAVKAYEILIDPSKRRRYDRAHGHDRVEEATRSYETSEDNTFSCEDVLEEFFGARWKRCAERKVNDLRFDLQIFRNAMNRETYEFIDYQRLVYCQECFGKSRNGSRKVCEKCYGVGEFEENCTLKVRIPPDSGQGTRIRISGAGDKPFPSSPAGDLVIVLHMIDAEQAM